MILHTTHCCAISRNLRYQKRTVGHPNRVSVKQNQLIASDVGRPTNTDFEGEMTRYSPV